MTFATRWPSRLVPIAFLATLLVAPGCQENDGTNVAPGDFTAKTEGTPAELAEHITRLNAKYASADPKSPAVSRNLLMAFSAAVIKTTDALITNPKTDPKLREEALRFQFTAYGKRKEIDPKAEDEMLAAAEKIEAANPKTEIATRAAEQVARLMGERAQYGPEAERHERYAMAGKAVIHAASMDPPPDRGADILLSFANDCEAKLFFDLAKLADEALVKYYPKSPATKFAEGAIHRHDLKGKLIDDLVGKGAGGKTVSIKDFRGKVVLVAFWVSSPEASVIEMMDVEKFRKQYDSKDFEVLGISLDPEPAKAEKLLVETKIAWPQIYSSVPNQELESEQGLRYGVKAIAYKFVVDREGRLVDYGYILSQVRPTLEKLLPKPVEKVEKTEIPTPVLETPKAK